MMLSNLLSVFLVLLIVENSTCSDKSKRQTVSLCTNQGLCFNQGICYVISGSVKCVCPEGYTGSLCETPTSTSTAGCSPNPCLNGATCVTNTNGGFFGCFCATGYIGVYCQTKQTTTTTTTTTTTPARGCAASNPCKNGATCVNDAIGNFFGCFCASGYSGLFCDTPTTSSTCTATSCFNGAFCVPYSSTEKWCNPSQVGKTCCKCLAGYTGAQCETDIDECASSPCKNGATCDNLVNAYRCRCPPGFSGVNCEISTSTTTNSCANKPCGTFPCLESPNFPNGFVCQCGINDFRPNCSGVAVTTTTTTTTASTTLNVSLCADQTVCRNQGVCYNINGALRCVCPQGFTGLLCETRG